MKQTWLYFFCLFFFAAQLRSQSWSWAKSATGNGYDEGYAVCADIHGNVLCTGYFKSTNFACGTYSLQNAGNQDVFLLKYDPNGNILWAKSFGSSGADFGTAVNTDKFGNIYLTGYYSSIAIVFGADTLINAGSSNCFITKLDQTGNTLWSKTSNSTVSAAPWTIRTDSLGNSYIAGTFNSSSFSFGNYTVTNSGGEDIFIAKLDASGNIQWLRSEGGNTNDIPLSLAQDDVGRLYLSGTVKSSTCNFGGNTYTIAGSSYLARYNPSTGLPIWVRTSTDNNSSENYSCITDSAGFIYTTGYFSDPTTAFGTQTLSNSGMTDFYLVKYDSTGNAIWARNGFSPADDYGHSLARSNKGVYLMGSMQTAMVLGSYTLPVQVNTLIPLFFAKYDEAGSVVFATEISSGGNSTGGLWGDKNSNIYACSDFCGASMAVGSTTLTQTGLTNIFVAKMSTANLQFISENAARKNIIYYPNPSAGIILLSDALHETSVLSLFNNLGQIVRQESIGDNQIQINIQNLENGIYHFIIQSESGIKKAGKIIIEAK